MVAGTGRPWRCRGGLDGGCETGTRLGYGAFRGRNATNIFVSLLRRFGQQDEIHNHKQQSNPMEMLIEGFGSDWDVIEGQKRFKVPISHCSEARLFSCQG